MELLILCQSKVSTGTPNRSLLHDRTHPNAKMDAAQVDLDQCHQIKQVVKVPETEVRTPWRRTESPNEQPVETDCPRMAPLQQSKQSTPARA